MAGRGTYVGCSRLEDVLDQALADGQDLGEFALDLCSTSTTISCRSQISASHGLDGQQGNVTTLFIVERP